MKKLRSVRVVCVTPPQAKTVHVNVSGVTADASAALAREMADFITAREQVRAEIARGGRRTSGRIL